MELGEIEYLVTSINESLEEIKMNVQDKGWITNPNKLKAEALLERLYHLAQLDFKIIDIRLTLDKVNNVTEEGTDIEDLVDAIQELEDSNDEENERLI